MTGTLRHRCMEDVNQVKQIRYQQGQSIPGDVKLHGIVDLGHHFPVVQELVSIDVGELADIPDLGRQFAGQELEDTVMLQFESDNSRRDVVESPAVYGSIQLTGQPAPALDRSFLSLRFEGHDLPKYTEPRARGRRATSVGAAIIPNVRPTPGALRLGG